MRLAWHGAQFLPTVLCHTLLLVHGTPPWHQKYFQWWIAENCCFGRTRARSNSRSFYRSTSINFVRVASLMIEAADRHTRWREGREREGGGAGRGGGEGGGGEGAPLLMRLAPHAAVDRQQGVQLNFFLARLSYPQLC